MAKVTLQKINTRAKSIRKAHPSMKWNAAQSAAAKQLKGGTTTTTRKKHHVSGTAAVGKTKRKRSVSGTAAVGTTRKKTKKKGFLGASGTTMARVEKIASMAMGFGVGAAGTHMILRPLEHKVVGMIPDPKVQAIAAKATPWAEMVLGAGIVWYGKGGWVSNIGWGVFGAGVHGTMKELPFHMHSPAETVNGVGQYVTTRIPMNGTIAGMVAGLIQQPNTYTKTPTVGASILNNGQNKAVHTPTVGAYQRYSHTPTVGEFDDEEASVFYSNPFRRP